MRIITDKNRAVGDPNVHIFDENGNRVGSLLRTMNDLSTYHLEIYVPVENYSPKIFGTLIEGFYGLRDILKKNGYDVIA